VIFGGFQSPEVRGTKRKNHQIHSQKYRMMIDDLYSISGLYPDLAKSSEGYNSPLWLQTKIPKKTHCCYSLVYPDRNSLVKIIIIITIAPSIVKFLTKTKTTLRQAPMS
jgi:hypothetical protein